MAGETIRLPVDDLAGRAARARRAAQRRPTVHGILVQMPLPKHIDPDTVIRRIRPDKDVDGFHPVNVGKLLIGDTDGFAPCTPAGVQRMLMRVRRADRGADCVDRRAQQHRRQADGGAA